MSTRPNILFIMDDQHRFDYLGAAGAPFIHTPNLDRLAERGVRFTHCATNSPICAPARIALATGLQAHRVAPLDNSSFLSHTQTTHYQRLRDHGYRVGCVGKLDLAKPDGYNGRYGDRPCVYRWGFTHPEECEGKIHAGASPTPQGPYNYYLQERGLLQKFYEDYRNRLRPVETGQEEFVASGWVDDGSYDSVLPADAFEDVYIGRRATEWLAAVPADFPWYYFVSFVGPHDPFDPPTEYAERYRHAEMPPPIRDALAGKPEWVKRRAAPRDPEKTAHIRRQYCAAITLIDDQIGRMLDVLEERDMLDNTVIVFSSDHGEMLADHGLYMKGVAYEQALRVPLLIAGPGIAGGRVSEALVELIDLNPTICELAGLPSQENIDARSLVPLLHSQTETHRPDILSTMSNFRCLRTERYKLIDNRNDRPELYDLQADPHELHNLAPDQPELGRTLRRRLAERLKEGQGMR